MNVAQSLRLNPEVIHAHADAYYGYALAERKPPLPPEVQADFLTVAASYRAAVDPAGSVKIFNEAAAHAMLMLRLPHGAQTDLNLHQQKWLARAATLCVCGAGKSDSQSVAAGFKPRPDNLSPHCAGALLLLHLNVGLQFPDHGRRFGLAQEALDWIRKLEGHRIGKLELPVSLYVNLAKSVMESADTPSKPVGRTWTAEFGERLAAPIHLAQTSDYQWENLHTSLLPIEIDALAITLVYVRAIGGQLEKDNAEFNYPQELRAYIEVAQEILRGPEPEREKRLRFR